MFKTCKKPPMSIISASGDICSFKSLQEGLPLKSHKIALTATQSGSGTPSPDNVRTINGYSNIGVGNISDNTNISYFQGLLNGTYGFVDLGTLNWNYRNDGTTYAPYFWCYTIISPFPSTIKYIGNFSSTAYNIICAKYKTTSRNTTNFIDKTIVADGGNDNVTQIQIKDLAYNDAATFKTAMSGVYLIYELATPTTPSFTSAEFKALCEAFGMNGQIITITIGSTVYGGEYDARTGVLTCNWVKANTSTMTWNISTSGLFFSYSLVGIIKNNTSPYTPSPYIKCSAFECVDSSGLSGPQGTNPSPNGVFAENVEGIVYFNLTSETTIEGFKAFMSDKQLIYELDTPQTIQLPPCPIDTLLGENNIWSDTGNTSLEAFKFGR